MNSTINTTPPPQMTGGPKKHHRVRNIVLIAFGGVMLIGAISIIANGGSTSSSPQPDHGSAAAVNPSGFANPTPNADNSAPANPAPSEVVPTTQAPTVAQQQALISAQSYLSDGQGFSKAGLLDQLTSSAGEGFSMADAKWAIRHAHPDWNAQAVESAKGYLKMGGFSRASLIDQLSSSAGEGFTLAQATYAANQVGL
jgi:hypothetical protein